MVGEGVWVGGWETCLRLAPLASYCLMIFSSSAWMEGWVGGWVGGWAVGRLTFGALGLVLFDDLLFEGLNGGVEVGLVLARACCGVGGWVGGWVDGGEEGWFLNEFVGVHGWMGGVGG